MLAGTGAGLGLLGWARSCPCLELQVVVLIAPWCPGSGPLTALVTLCIACNCIMVHARVQLCSLQSKPCECNCLLLQGCF